MTTLCLIQIFSCFLFFFFFNTAADLPLSQLKNGMLEATQRELVRRSGPRGFKEEREVLITLVELSELFAQCILGMSVSQHSL